MLFYLLKNCNVDSKNIEKKLNKAKKKNKQAIKNKKIKLF